MAIIGRHYRWIVVASASVGLGGAYGGISTISILIGPLESEFGWLRAEVSFAYTLLTLGAAVGGLVAGRLADRLPTAPIAAAGVLVIGLGLTLVAQMSSLVAIQAVYLTLGLFGFACLYAPLLTTVSLWFDRRAGLAMGIVTAGGALGQAIVPPVFEALVAAQGWRPACAVFGVGFVAVLLPAVALIRKPPVSAAGTPAAAYAGWPVPPALSIGLLAAAALFCCVLMGVPSVHLVAFATGEGLEPAAAARLAAVPMLMGALGRLAIGGVVDRLGSLATYALVSTVQTGAVYLFVTTESLAGLFAVAALYGFGFGGVMTALVCAVRDAVPRESVGGAMALVGLLAWLGMGVGGYQAGVCFDRTGSYDLPFLMAAVAGLANLGALGLLALIIRLRRDGATARPAFPAARLAA